MTTHPHTKTPQKNVIPFFGKNMFLAQKPTKWEESLNIFLDGLATYLTVWAIMYCPCVFSSLGLDQFVVIKKVYFVYNSLYNS
jgi:hypothetical protein